MKCNHPREYVSDSVTTDSDTVLLTIFCPDCKDLRTEEVIGSLARAFSDYGDPVKVDLNATFLPKELRAAR